MISLSRKLPIVDHFCPAPYRPYPLVDLLSSPTEFLCPRLLKLYIYNAKFIFIWPPRVDVMLYLMIVQCMYIICKCVFFSELHVLGYDSITKNILYHEWNMKTGLVRFKVLNSFSKMFFSLVNNIFMSCHVEKSN